MPRGGSGPASIRLTLGWAIIIVAGAILGTVIATTMAIDAAKYEDVTNIIVKYSYEKDSCFVLKTSTWEVTDSMLIIRSEERGSTRFFPLNEVKSIDVTERKVRILND